MLILVAGCFNAYEEDFVEEETIVQNAAIGQQLADDVLDMVYQSEVLQINNPGGISWFPGNTTDCGLILDHPGHQMFSIDFSSECTDPVGHTRSGRIVVNYESILGDTLADRTVTFDRYMINQKKLEGTIMLHEFAVSPAGEYTATRTLTDLKVIFPDGTGVTYNGSQSRVWTSGRGDTLADNNRYTFHGSMNGMSSTGRAFTQDIATPFISDSYSYALGFFARTYGVVELTTLAGYPDRKRTVNYGNDSTQYDHSITVSTFRRTYGVAAD